MPVRAASAQVIAADMIVDGMPGAIWALSFDAPAAQVEVEFRDYWRRASLPAIGTSGPRGITLSGLDGTCQYVLELPAGRAGGRTRGVLSAMRIDAAGVRHAIPASIAVLPGGQVLSDVESRDPAGAGRTWVVALGGRADDHARRYQDALLQAGWTSVTSRTASRGPGAGAAGPTTSIAMQRGAFRLDAVFAGPAGRATAVVNIMERS